MDTNFTRVAAYAVVVEDGRILLCRISTALSDDAGKWTSPGGRIEFGEHPGETVVRELLEETGLSVEVGKLVGVNSEIFHFTDSIMHGIRLLYLAKVLGGALTFGDDIATDMCAWFSLEDASELPLVTIAAEGLFIAFSEQ